MEFEFDDNLSAVRDLSESIFSAKSGVDRLREVEGAGGFDAELWKLLADSDVLGIALPEEVGGAGLGMLGLAAVLEQQGRRVAQVPLWSVISTAALPIAEFGSTEQKASWLPGLLDGSVIVTGAFDTGYNAETAVRAEPAPDGWVLSGHVDSVPAAEFAAALVVPVTMPDGSVTVMIVPTDRDALVRTPLAVTNRESNSAVQFDGVAVTAADALPRGRRGGSRLDVTTCAGRSGGPGYRRLRGSAGDDGEIHLRASAIRTSTLDQPGSCRPGRRRVSRHREHKIDHPPRCLADGQRSRE